MFKIEFNKISRIVISVVLVITSLSFSVVSAFATTKSIKRNSLSKVNTVQTKTTSQRKVTMKGIDVSRYNGVIDWSKAKKSVDFAIIQLGHGSNLKSQDDYMYKRNVEGCIKNKIPFGVYLYSYAITTKQAKSEAEHALRQIKGYKLDFPVYYDMEDNSQKKLSSSMRGKIASTFCNAIISKGYKVGIYACRDWWNRYLTSSVFNNPKWDKWVAEYGYSCEYKGNYSTWQYSDKGRIPGINTIVDLDNYYGNKVTSSYAYSMNLKTTNMILNISNRNNGQTKKLNVTMNDKSGMTFTSSNKNVATVNSKGEVTAKKKGICNIKIASKKDKRIVKNCKVQVKQLVTNIIDNNKNITFANQNINKTLLPKIYPSNANNKALKWTSSNTKVATVDSTGKITTKGKGLCVVKATAVDSSRKSISYNITVDNTIIEKLNFKEPKKYAEVGAKFKNIATYSPTNATSKVITYSSTNNKVATVDNEGNVECLSIGSCKIVATVEGNNKVTSSYDVYVRQLANKITINKNKIMLYKGNSFNLLAKIKPENVTVKKVKWRTSNNKIATVDSNGKVTAKSKGTCTITATTTDGTNISCKCTAVIK